MKRKPANPSDRRLTIRFDKKTLDCVLRDASVRRDYPGPIVRKIVTLYYGGRGPRIK
jgi:hypothetical protein